MKTPNVCKEEGQSLVQLAVMLVVLIGFVGLAIDGGSLYAERRRMQNAADAGALAGARQMCLVNDATAAKNIAVSYMRKNGDSDATTADVDVQGYKVTARAKKSVSPFLPFTFSGSINVPANASAACGAANKACGIWPMGLPAGDWDSYESAACSTGKKILVTMDDYSSTSCKNTAGTTLTGLCNCYQCQYQSKDVFVRDGITATALLDFSQIPNLVTGTTQNNNGCGTSELLDNFRGTAAIQISLNSCIAQINGNRSDPQIRNAIDTRAGEVLSLPLFDNQSCTGASCNGGTNRHIASFACVTLQKDASNKAVMDITLKAIPGMKKANGNGALGDTTIKAIVFAMNCNNSCANSCGSTDGSPPDSNGVNATNLVPFP